MQCVGASATLLAKRRESEFKRVDDRNKTVTKWKIRRFFLNELCICTRKSAIIVNLHNIQTENNKIHHLKDNIFNRNTVREEQTCGTRGLNPCGLEPV